MSDGDGTRRGAGRNHIADEIVGHAAEDVVFVMRFLGRSQHRLLGHFRQLIERELAARGMTRDDHPLLQRFIDRHAAELRDFVFAGVSLSRQFRIHEIEALTGDTETLMRIDIWDQLISHIGTAERRFLDEVETLPAALERMEADLPGPVGNRDGSST